MHKPRRPSIRCSIIHWSRFYTQNTQNIYKKYADTLSLPRTKFPNRPKSANTQKFLKQTCSDLYEWQAEHLPAATLKVLHDGPPYANGDLHLGHALNKTLKDIINRYNVIRGRRVQYIPGWDCHGLPIEHSALQRARKKHGSKVDRYSIYEKRELAAKLADEMSAKQLEGFKNFGVMADWGNGLIYKTLSTDYVLRQLRVFRSLVAGGLISRQDRPVYWSVESNTALAEGELQYGEKKSITAQVRYPITEPSIQLASILKQNGISPNSVNLVIWTTTPWTLAANRAIAINPDLTYGLVEVPNHGTLVVAKDLYGSISDGKILGIEFSGNVLSDTLYKDLIRDGPEEYPVLPAHYVTSSSGTGLVHTAPGHGNEDYLLGKSYGIEAYSPIDDQGRYNENIHHDLRNLIGLDARRQGQEEILKKATESGVLLKTESIVHSVPLDWRTKTPVIVRSTPQMFANVESIKSKAVSALNNVEFIPQSGKSRLTAFIESRNEWCISRQRAWGVPIPCVFDKETGQPEMNLEIVDHIIKRIEELSQISEINPLSEWFKNQEDISEWLPSTYDSRRYRKGTDTMDVWFDSGTSWTMLPEREFLADYYLEGSDQHRGWFQSSLLTKIATEKDKVSPNAPFRHLITHGFLLDKDGRKMSKSIGNVVSPKDLISGSDKIQAVGIDGMRLWIAQSDYTADVTISPFIISQVAASMRKLRLTYKFLLGNLRSSEENIGYNVPYEELQSVDKKALFDLYVLNRTVTEAYESFAFNKAVKAVQNHMNVALSAFYFDILKDRLYADAEKSISRQSALSVLSEILKMYITLLAPITPLLSQEVWQMSPSYISKGTDSPFKSGWINVPEKWNNAEIGADFEKILDLRKAVTETIELARSDKKLGSSLEADIYLNKVSSTELSVIIEKYQKELSNIFITSHVFVDEACPSSDWIYQGNHDGVQISVLPSNGHKCPRCWTFTAKEENHLCDRCTEVLKIT